MLSRKTLKPIYSNGNSKDSLPSKKSDETLNLTPCLHETRIREPVSSSNELNKLDLITSKEIYCEISPA